LPYPIDVRPDPGEEERMSGMTGMTKCVARLTVLALPALLAAILAAGALAGSPSSAVYGNTGAKVDAALAPATSSAPTAAQAASTTGSSTLPFTGLDLGVICAAGVLLIGVGFTLRRVTRKSPPS
jgi:hypothetical protein